MAHFAASFRSIMELDRKILYKPHLGVITVRAVFLILLLTFSTSFASMAWAQAHEKPSMSIAVSPTGERVLYAPRVKYPYEARLQGLEGRGFYAMHVRKDGTVKRVEIIQSTGHRILDQAVITALRQWRFRPGSLDVITTPVKFTMVVPPKTTNSNGVRN